LEEENQMSVHKITRFRKRGQFVLIFQKRFAHCLHPRVRTQHTAYQLRQWDT